MIRPPPRAPLFPSTPLFRSTYIYINYVHVYHATYMYQVFVQAFWYMYIHTHFSMNYLVKLQLSQGLHLFVWSRLSLWVSCGTWQLQQCSERQWSQKTLQSVQPLQSVVWRSQDHHCHHQKLRLQVSQEEQVVGYSKDTIILYAGKYDLWIW